MISDSYNSITIESPKPVNLLDNTPIQPSKFRTKNWFEINDDHGMVTPIVKSNLIKTILKSGLYD